MGWRRMYFKCSLYEIRSFENTKGYTHIAIKRVDGKPIRATWDVLQAIKNEAVGEDAYAVEVFPETDKLVFQENMRHLFVFPPGERLDLHAGW